MPPSRLGKIGFYGAVFLALAHTAHAHEPIFTPGAHVHYKGGQEVSLTYNRNRSSGAGETETEQEMALGYEYGVTANWTVSTDIPLVDKINTANRSSGLGDVQVRTKYRFLRTDLPGQQYSTTALFQVKLPTGNDNKSPKLGSGSTDFVGGLLHGLESRRWYYNVAARYRHNTKGGGGLKKGDKVLFDLVAGVRPILTHYKAPDTVLFLELNSENSRRDERHGNKIANTGGRDLFLSPGIFWTTGVYALTGGVQIPIAKNLNGNQPASDYRFRLSMKYEF